MVSILMPGRLETGAGSLNNLGKLVGAAGGSKVLVIMDSFLAQESQGVGKRVKDILAADKILVEFFTGFTGEPTTDDVEQGVGIAREFGADCIVAVGGGSSLDIAKGVAVFSKNAGLEWQEIVGRNYLDCLPIIAVPTTAGTGSEATKIMVIINSRLNSKMNPGHPDLVPKVAVLDPDLTVTLPRKFTAFTGMDALNHAIEAYVSIRANQITDFYALEAIRICGGALPKAYSNGADLEARQQMLLGSYYAGIAFSNASTNLAHAGGRALGAKFHIPHGLSVSLLLPFVMDFGLQAAQDRYAKVAVALGADRTLAEAELAKEAVKIIEEYNTRFLIWEAAKDYIKNPAEFIAAVPYLVEDTMLGVKLNPTGNNGIVTNRKIPAENDVADMFKLLAEKLSQV
ncbi:MAG: iron-containing alcohol dehydrogenase [Peptococcaceae bacterium]